MSAGDGIVTRLVEAVVKTDASMEESLGASGDVSSRKEMNNSIEAEPVVDASGDGEADMIMQPIPSKDGKENYSTTESILESRGVQNEVDSLGEIQKDDNAVGLNGQEVGLTAKKITWDDMTNSCSAESKGKLFEMGFRIQFLESGGYSVVQDDTVKLATLYSYEKEQSHSEICFARRRLMYEPEPPRYLETLRNVDSKSSNNLDLDTMASLTRNRGLTRFEVAIMTKDITYNSRFLEIQDEHKTPGMIQTDYDYVDAELADELKILDSPSEASYVDHIMLKVLNLQKLAKSVAFKMEMNSNDPLSLRCQVCLKAEIVPLKCKDCLKIAYCSKEHQKLDWKTHKKNCIPSEIKTNDTLGRHLVARYEIKPGTLIIGEFPLVSGPIIGDCIVGNIAFDIKGLVKEEDEEDVMNQMGTFSLEEIKHLAGSYFLPKCLGCYIDLKTSVVNDVSGPVPVCSRCGWPLCSSSCSKLENHQLECEYFRSKAINFRDVQSNYCIVPRVFIILRCLLLKENYPQKWKILMNMEGHLEKREDWEKSNGPRFHDLYIVRLLKSGFKCEADLKLIRTIIGIIDCNAMYGGRLVSQENNHCDAMKRVVGLFEKASLLSHSCVPNAIVIVSPHNHRVEVIAGRTIKKGEPILIDYDYMGNVRNKFDRQEFLISNYFVDCKCPVCTDPTENGLFLCGVTCTKCRRKGREGYLCPTDPLDEQQPWKCCTCGFERPESAIVKVTYDAKIMLSSSTGGYVRTLEKVRSSILHKHNTVILDAELGTTRTFLSEDFQNICRLDDEAVSFMKTSLKARLHVLEQLYPAMDKRIINCRLALCDVAILESVRANELEKVKVCLQSCGEHLTELIGLFHNADSFNQYHAFVLRIVRTAASKLQQVNSRRTHLYSAYYQMLSESVKLSQNISQLTSRTEDIRKDAKNSRKALQGKKAP